jgi:primosomal protein N''
MKKTMMLIFLGTAVLSGTQTLNAQTTKTQRPTKNQPQYPSIIDLENKGAPPKTGTAEQPPDAGSTNVQAALVRAVESLTSEVRTLVHEMRALNVRQQAQLDLLRLTRGDLRIDSYDRELRSTIDRLAQIERDEQTLRAALTPEGLAAQVSRVGSIDKDETTRVIKRDLEARLAPLVSEKERLRVRKTELEGVVLGFRDANDKAERRLELVDDALRQLAAPAATDERKAGRKPDLD